MSITSANAIIQIGVATLFPTPQQLQGFSTNDVYSSSSVKRAVTQMGVDGKQSGGFIYASKPIVYHLQADSVSMPFFDTWIATQEALQDILEATGLTTLKGIGSKFSMVKGVLTDYDPMPSASEALKPRNFTITWEQIIKAPV